MKTKLLVTMMALLILLGITYQSVYACSPAEEYIVWPTRNATVALNTKFLIYSSVQLNGISEEEILDKVSLFDENGNSQLLALTETPGDEHKTPYGLYIYEFVAPSLAPHEQYHIVYDHRDDLSIQYGMIPETRYFTTGSDVDLTPPVFMGAAVVANHLIVDDSFCNSGVIQLLDLELDDEQLFDDGDLNNFFIQTYISSGQFDADQPDNVGLFRDQTTLVVGGSQDEELFIYISAIDSAGNQSCVYRAPYIGLDGINAFSMEVNDSFEPVGDCIDVQVEESVVENKPWVCGTKIENGNSLSAGGGKSGGCSLQKNQTPNVSNFLLLILAFIYGVAIKNMKNMDKLKI